MKTTVEISDALMARAKRYSRRSGKSLRALVEEGLRRVLDEETSAPAYRLPDLSVGDPRGPDPLESLSWSELRDEIYGGPR
jgi:hypothetical protein